MHKHLQRLDRVWIEFPIIPSRSCTFRAGDRPNRVVVMPDHMHFFCASEYNVKTLSIPGEWKCRTCRRVNALLRASSTTLWQREFFDHIFRSNESYVQKWDYDSG